jgi:hypothetical protein
MMTALMLAAPAASQTLPPRTYSTSLAGPRFGITFLSDGVVDKLSERNITVEPYVSQFGWQVEKQFIGGLDQSVALPSLSWMVGVRTPDGAEFGIGPNITPAGSALVLATGMTFRAGPVNVPLNVAVIPSKAGTRLTVLSGFALRRH